MENKETLPGKTKKTNKNGKKAKCFGQIKVGDLLYKVEGEIIRELTVKKIFRFSYKPYSEAEYEERMLGFYFLYEGMLAMKDMFAKCNSFQGIYTAPETAIKALKAELEKIEKEAYATYKKACDTRTETVDYYLKKYHLDLTK